MSSKPTENEVTPETIFLNRRSFIRTGVFAGSAIATASAYRLFNTAGQTASSGDSSAAPSISNVSLEGENPNSFEEITNYNNFYEFSTDKREVAIEAKNWITRPWTVEVGGLVQKARTLDIEELLQVPHEERIYRFRCVEAWSMVIPWNGFTLSELLKKVQPLGSAKYVAFQTYYDPEVMESSWSAGIDFPYVEGLRLDEAMHPLTLLATGIYGKPMPNQNGSPIRLVVPWKYGFKSIKSIAKITLTDREPPTTWNNASPREYGFYSNVNPEVDHPRWSQVKERRIGEIAMRKTLMFNGYGGEVASMYSGMDLRKHF